MHLKRIVALLGLGLVCIAPVEAAISRAALDHVRGLAVSRVGIDATGRLWAWDAVDGMVAILSAGGSRRFIDVDSDVKALDVDSNRGIALLGNDGTSVKISGLDGRITSQFTLPVTANNIVWLEGDQVGVTPERAPSLVDVWSTSTKKRVRSFGDVPEIKVPARGAALNRATLVRFEAARRELAVFDAFYGDLAVFDPEGRVVRSAKITHPRLAANLLWLKSEDANARTQGESSMPTFYQYPRMSMSRDGTVWLGEEGSSAESVTLVRVSPQGKVRRQSVSVPQCASVRYEVWQDQLVFYREPKSPRKPCIATKEVPH
jgi:hypothetical protein